MKTYSKERKEGRKEERGGEGRGGEGRGFIIYLFIILDDEV
jgi:hypothetical protein